VLAEHLAQSLGLRTRARPPISDSVSFLLHELSTAPELWVQKGYLCRVATRDGASFVDDGVLPLAHFLDATDDDAVAASVEVNERGAIVPMLYVRRNGELSEHAFESHPLHDYESDTYRREISPLVR
jgi:hypothetical protein